MARFYYLRDKTNIHRRPNGEFSRGNPIALIITDVDRATNTVKYAVSTTHPKDHFDKMLAKRIASSRLANEPVLLQNAPAAGHDITKMVMQHIAETTTARTLKLLAEGWLAAASIPKAIPLAGV